jgi:hypothetical protein
VSITIRDAAGKVVRTIAGTRQAGLNRVYWDLRNEGTRPPRLRSKPEFNDEFQMDRDGTRAAPGFGAFSVLMPPGRYTVQLAAEGRTLERPLEVRKDPNTTGTIAEIRAQTDVMLALQADHRATAEMLGTIEEVRAQTRALTAQLAGDASAAAVRAGADSLEQRFIALERRFIDLRLTGRGQDEVRYPVRLAGQIGYVAGGIASSDFAPTTQQRDVQTDLARRVREARAELDRLLDQDLARFNAVLRGRGLKPIEVRAAGIAVR